MYADKFSLDKYLIKRAFPSRVVIMDEAKRPLFRARMPVFKKKIILYEFNALDRQLLEIEWKLKRGLTGTEYFYNIIDASHSLLAYISCESDQVFSRDFKILDNYKNVIGGIQADQLDATAPLYMNIVHKGRRCAVFYRFSNFSESYIMDMAGDVDKTLDRKLILAIAAILAFQPSSMRKFSGKVDWNKSVVAGDDRYKIKSRQA